MRIALVSLLLLALSALCNGQCAETSCNLITSYAWDFGTSETVVSATDETIHNNIEYVEGESFSIDVYAAGDLFSADDLEFVRSDATNTVFLKLNEELLLSASGAPSSFNRLASTLMCGVAVQAASDNSLLASACSLLMFAGANAQLPCCQVRVIVTRPVVGACVPVCDAEGGVCVNGVCECKEGWTNSDSSRTCSLLSSITAWDSYCAEVNNDWHHENAQQVPGGSGFGRGFDFTSYTLRSNVLDMEIYKGCRTIDSSTEAMGNTKNRIPYNIELWSDVTTTSGNKAFSAFDSASTMANEFTTTLSVDVAIEAKIPIPLPGVSVSAGLSGSTNRMMSTAFEQEQEGSSSYFYSDVVSQVAELRTRPNYLYLADTFLKSLQLLPVPDLTLDELLDSNLVQPAAQANAYKKIFQDYGTHYVRSGKLGGRLSMWYSFDKSSNYYKTSTDKEIQDCLGVSIGVETPVAGGEVSTNVCEGETSSSGSSNAAGQEASKSEFTILGGEAATQNAFDLTKESLDAWLASLPGSPAPLFLGKEQGGEYDLILNLLQQDRLHPDHYVAIGDVEKKAALLYHGFNAYLDDIKDTLIDRCARPRGCAGPIGVDDPNLDCTGVQWFEEGTCHTCGGLAFGANCTECSDLSDAVDYLALGFEESPKQFCPAPPKLNFKSWFRGRYAHVMGADSSDVSSVRVTNFNSGSPEGESCRYFQEVEFSTDFWYHQQPEEVVITPEMPDAAKCPLHFTDNQGAVETRTPTLTAQVQWVDGTPIVTSVNLFSCTQGSRGWLSFNGRLPADSSPIPLNAGNEKAAPLRVYQAQALIAESQAGAVCGVGRPEQSWGPTDDLVPELTMENYWLV